MRVGGVDAGVGKIEEGRGCGGASSQLLEGGLLDPDDDQDPAGGGGDQRRQQCRRQLLVLLLRGGEGRRTKSKPPGGAKAVDWGSQHVWKGEDAERIQTTRPQQGDGQIVDISVIPAAAANATSASDQSASATSPEYSNKTEGKAAQKRNSRKRWLSLSGSRACAHFILNSILTHNLCDVCLIYARTRLPRGIFHAPPPTAGTARCAPMQTAAKRLLR